MATLTSINSKAGKCSNFGNCSIADARTTVEVPSGLDFVCTECRKPLLLMDAGSPAGRSKALVAGVLLVVLLLMVGASWFVLSGKKSVDPTPPPQTSAPVEAAPPTAPSGPLSGNCSAADEMAGVCKIAR